MPILLIMARPAPSRKCRESSRPVIRLAGQRRLYGKWFSPNLCRLFPVMPISHLKSVGQFDGPVVHARPGRHGPAKESRVTTQKWSGTGLARSARTEANARDNEEPSEVGSADALAVE